jgi:hypothetical protein
LQLSGCFDGASRLFSIPEAFVIEAIVSTISVCTKIPKRLRSLLGFQDAAVSKQSKGFLVPVMVLRHAHAKFMEIGENKMKGAVIRTANSASISRFTIAEPGIHGQVSR